MSPRLPAFAWIASLAILGMSLINFLGALTGARWCAPLAWLLASTGAESAAGGRLSGCLLLGDCVPGSFGQFGLVDVGCLAALALCTGVLTAGVRRIQGGGDADPQRGFSGRLSASWPWLAGGGVGLTLAGAIGTALEAAGVWTGLAWHPNPAAEQGAPVWVPWLISALLVSTALFATRYSGSVRSRNRAATCASMCLAAALAALVAAVVVHTSLPEPVQGRYYGLPGFVVGRSQNYEYGTYLGMLAPAAAGLCCLILLVVAARPRPSPALGPLVGAKTGRAGGTRETGSA